mmetsp:Transcript_19356/g.34477  ORF Transcript_19356/g.34477 Transcript_19356/m.34477 type:complete len:396 (+) Transcript_19356:631-1818(+)
MPIQQVPHYLGDDSWLLAGLAAAGRWGLDPHCALLDAAILEAPKFCLLGPPELAEERRGSLLLRGGASVQRSVHIERVQLQTNHDGHAAHRILILLARRKHHARLADEPNSGPRAAIAQARRHELDELAASGYGLWRVSSVQVLPVACGRRAARGAVGAQVGAQRPWAQRRRAQDQVVGQLWGNSAPEHGVEGIRLAVQNAQRSLGLPLNLFHERTHSPQHVEISLCVVEMSCRCLALFRRQCRCFCFSKNELLRAPVCRGQHAQGELEELEGRCLSSCHACCQPGVGSQHRQDKTVERREDRDARRGRGEEAAGNCPALQQQDRVAQGWEPLQRLVQGLQMRAHLGVLQHAAVVVGSGGQAVCVPSPLRPHCIPIWPQHTQLEQLRRIGRKQSH